jgi:hypothetical protein
MAHTTRRVGVALAVAVVAASLALAPIALAGKSTASGKGGSGGKPPGGGSATISLVLLNSSDGLAHYGQTVTFNISTTATDQPWVNLKCYRNGALLGEGWAGYFPASLSGRDFLLSSPQWSGGAADCTAYVTTPQWAVLGSTSFHVYP